MKHFAQNLTSNNETHMQVAQLHLLATSSISTSTSNPTTTRNIYTSHIALPPPTNSTHLHNHERNNHRHPRRQRRPPTTTSSPSTTNRHTPTTFNFSNNHIPRSPWFRTVFQIEDIHEVGKSDGKSTPSQNPPNNVL